MPVHVVKKSGAKPYKICEKDGTVVGSSDTKAKADAACRARNAAWSKR